MKRERVRKMKGFYRLLNYECAMMLKAMLFIGLGVVFMPLVLIGQATKDYGTGAIHERYEDIYMFSGSAFSFLIGLALLCIFFVIRQYAGYWGGRSIYTFLTLPIRREALYFSRLTAFIIGLLLLLAAQIIGMRLGYSLMAGRISAYGDGAFLMHNGLFLTFIRSSFQRILLPLGFQELLSTASVIIALTTGIYYGVICERSKRYWNFILLGAAFLIIFNVLSYRMNMMDYLYNFKNMYRQSFMLIGLSAIFIWHSLKLLKKSAIA